MCCEIFYVANCMMLLKQSDKCGRSVSQRRYCREKQETREETRDDTASRSIAMEIGLHTDAEVRAKTGERGYEESSKKGASS
jgi:hypothetical protein